MKWSYGTGEMNTEYAPAAARRRGRAHGRLARLARVFAAACAADDRADLRPFCTYIARAQFACSTQIGLRCGRLWIIF